MTTLPRITIITPNLNQGRFLERAICSVLDQGYANLQYIVADGGSDDESLSILGEYRHQLGTLIHQPDTGPAQGINRALVKADGDIVGILHADDILLPGALDAVATHMRGANGAGWVIGQSLRISQRDRLVGRVEPQAPSSFASFLMRDSGNLPGVGGFIQKKILDKLGELDESLLLAFDHEYACRMIASDIQPTIIGSTLAAGRECSTDQRHWKPVRRGLEMIATARRYALTLPLTQRYAVWRSCDRRERIFALAQAELFGQESRKFLFHQLMRHPWWLTSGGMRKSLWHGGASTHVHLPQAA